MVDVIDQYVRFPLPRLWGGGHAAIADGTHAKLRENNRMGSQHVRYGAYGGIAYHHIADSYIALFTSFISCGVWETVHTGATAVSRIVVDYVLDTGCGAAKTGEMPICNESVTIYGVAAGLVRGEAASSGRAVASSRPPLPRILALSGPRAVCGFGRLPCPDHRNPLPAWSRKTWASRT
jgi:hypothetical protein